MILDWMSAFIKIAERAHTSAFKIILEGPPQTGKTFFGKVLADEVGAQLYKLSCSDSMRPEELFYNVVAPNNVVNYAPSPILEAFSASQDRGVVLVIDEFDKTRARAEDLFLSAFEDYAFRLPTGEMVRANPENLYVVMASNARRQLREETLRRFPYRYVVKFPEKTAQISILSELSPNMPRNVAAYLVKVATVLRKEDAFKAPSYGELVAIYEGARALLDTALIREVLTPTLWKESGEPAPVGWRWEKGLVAEMHQAGVWSY